MIRLRSSVDSRHKEANKVEILLKNKFDLIWFDRLGLLWRHQIEISIDIEFI